MDRVGEGRKGRRLEERRRESCCQLWIPAPPPPPRRRPFTIFHLPPNSRKWRSPSSLSLSLSLARARPLSPGFRSRHSRGWQRPLELSLLPKGNSAAAAYLHSAATRLVEIGVKQFNYEFRHASRESIILIYSSGTGKLRLSSSFSLFLPFRSQQHVFMSQWD